MGDVPKFVTVSCANHHETLVQRLWHFFKTGQGLDFDFPSGGGRPILAHMLVVDAFMSLDNFGPDRKAQRESGRDMSASLDSLLEFMYCGTVSVPEEGLQDLLDTAREFDFKMLVESIETALTRSQTQQQDDDTDLLVYFLEAADTDGINVVSQEIDVESAPMPPSPSPPKKRVRSKKRKRAQEAEEEALQESSSKGKKKKKKKVKQEEEVVVETKKGEPGPKSLIQCEHCRFSTYNQPAIRVHMSKHDPTISVVRCSVCGHRFADVKTVPQHRCYDRNRYRCAHCTFRTYDKATFQLHLATHDPSSAMPVMRCRTCNKPFLRLKMLEKHEAKQHSGNDNEPPKTYSCNHCKYESPNRVTYMNHLFKRHDLDMHGAPLRKNLHCDRCDYSCVRPSELRNHKIVKHSTEKPYKCPICPYAAALRRDLHIHNNRIHLRVRNFPCDLCDRRFSTNHDLERHRRTHTGERPHVCDVCGKAYAGLATLRFHAKCHEEIAERHICHICGHVSKRHQYLKGHLMSVHKLTAAAASAASRPNRAKPAAVPSVRGPAAIALPVEGRVIP